MKQVYQFLNRKFLNKRGGHSNNMGIESITKTFIM